MGQALASGAGSPPFRSIEAISRFRSSTSVTHTGGTLAVCRYGWSSKTAAHGLRYDQIRFGTASLFLNSANLELVCLWGASRATSPRHEPVVQALARYQARDKLSRTPRRPDCGHGQS